MPDSEAVTSGSKQNNTAKTYGNVKPTKDDGSFNQVAAFSTLAEG